MDTGEVINKKLPKNAKFNNVYVRPNRKIIDLLRDGDTGVVVCVHGKTWRENGKGCHECMDHDGYKKGLHNESRVLKLNIAKKKNYNKINNILLNIKL